MGALKRIVFHWTAGTSAVSALDRAHYHYVISGDGIVVEGDHAPNDNIPPLRDYAAHTLSLNSGSIGVALAGMAQSAELPFAPGPWPITDAQIDALVSLLARLCRQHDIAVTRQTVLSHAEVQPTLGVAQRGKWDISWLPGMSAVGDPVEVGDKIRSRVLAELGKNAPVEPVTRSPATLRQGARGDDVRRMQRAVGVRDDGIFGPATAAALRNWQSARGLTPDAICGPKSWIEIIEQEKKR